MNKEIDDLYLFAEKYKTKLENNNLTKEENELLYKLLLEEYDVCLSIMEDEVILLFNLMLKFKYHTDVQFVNIDNLNTNNLYYMIKRLAYSIEFNLESYNFFKETLTYERMKELYKKAIHSYYFNEEIPKELPDELIFEDTIKVFDFLIKYRINEGDF